jgi:high-affinity nickel-transport protein
VERLIRFRRRIREFKIMKGAFLRVFRDAPADFRFATIGLYVFLAAANIAIWVAAWIAFHAYPVLLGTALLAYGFGLRHAVDADHIAAIDNVVRKLMQEGKRPVSVGFFFSLGHSTVVILMSAVVALSASALQGRFDAFKVIGGIIGTSMSSFFLLLVAIMNIFILAGTLKTFRRVREGGHYEEEDMDMIIARGGPLAHLFRPLFNLIRKSWHMYPLGFLFGLGFDTATEVALLAISATEATKGLPVWSVLLFPALFTAGMSLVDTTDGILMLGAYGWAFLNPLRKLFYNITVTAVSVIVALLVGGIEALGLIGDQFAFSGRFWGFIGSLNDNFGELGYMIIGIFALCWAVSALLYRARGYDKIVVVSRVRD